MSEQKQILTEIAELFGEPKPMTEAEKKWALYEMGELSLQELSIRELEEILDILEKEVQQIQDKLKRLKRKLGEE